MRYTLALLALGTYLSPFFSPAQTADHVVISEFAAQGPVSGSDEFVEIYNPTKDDLEIKGWRLQFKLVTGTSWVDKAVLLPGSVIPAHGYFLIANTNYTGPVEADYTSDLWSATSGINSVGHLRIVNPDTAEIDKAGYGTMAIDPEGSPAPQQPSLGGSVERKAFAASTADSLARGGLHYLSGNGYDTDDNGADFVPQTHGRNPQNTQSVPEPPFGIAGNGTGIVTVSPGKIFSGRRVSLAFSIAGDTGYVLNVVKLILPPDWMLHLDPDSVALGGEGMDTASLSITQDTLAIARASLSASRAGQISIPGLTSPTKGGRYTFVFLTAVAGGTPARILIQPSVQVKAPVPLALIHINDFQGVPAQPYTVGAEVSVTGTVTANISPVQTNVFIQDGTGGINLFNYSRPIDYRVGDSVMLTGKIGQFRGLTEIVPDSSAVVIIASGVLMPPPLLLTCAGVNNAFQPDYSEPDEGRLIRINAVSYNSANSTITDASGSASIFIPNSFPPSPTLFDCIGILKQYKPGTSPPPPFTADYEMSPRVAEDIIGHPGPVITVSPVEDSILDTQVRISWATDVPSSSVVYFGTSTYTDTVTEAAPIKDHSVWLMGLAPATFYHYAVGSSDSSGTTVVSDFLMSTASPGGSTGEINVYFNKDVDSSVSAAETASGNQSLTSILLRRLNSASHSIDACFYNLSGTPGNAIASALLAAKGRGVSVRVICEADNFHNAPFGILNAGGVPLITDEFDALNGGAGLMHNKFIVTDYPLGAADSVWVWTGSWNPTDPGTNNDRQDAIEIQDVALAGAYTAEFQEMWGTGGPTPDASLSRFGAHKLDNTPHRFNIKGTLLKCYFSPSDKTTYHIGDAIGGAKKSVCVAMDTFTRKDLADSLIAKNSGGAKVRIVLDNNTDTGNQYAYLLSQGVDIRLKGFSGGLLHHKYAIVDGTQYGGLQWIITGSHNWSTSAESRNDENTLIIRNQRLANFYLQEFSARYTEAGGTDRITLSATESGKNIPAAYWVSQNYPNPFNPSTRLKIQLPRSGFVSMKVYDVLGREKASLVNGVLQPGTYEIEWDASSCASGVYYYMMKSGGFTEVKKMLLVR